MVFHIAIGWKPDARHQYGKTSHTALIEASSLEEAELYAEERADRYGYDVLRVSAHEPTATKVQLLQVTSFGDEAGPCNKAFWHTDGCRLVTLVDVR